MRKQPAGGSKLRLSKDTLRQLTPQPKQYDDETLTSYVLCTSWKGPTCPSPLAE
jgi:hypothetical protein